MPAKPVVFKESDVRRALRAGSKEKFPIDRYEIATDGTIRVFAAPPDTKFGTELDKWLEGHTDAGQAQGRQ